MSAPVRRSVTAIDAHRPDLTAAFSPARCRHATPRVGATPSAASPGREAPGAPATTVPSGSTTEERGTGPRYSIQDVSTSDAVSGISLITPISIRSGPAFW